MAPILPNTQNTVFEKEPNETSENIADKIPTTAQSTDSDKSRIMASIQNS
jgi:hypothetical protein